MSPRAFIIERQNARARTWQVRYSVRGRTTKVHWGTYRTKRDMVSHARAAGIQVNIITPEDAVRCLNQQNGRDT